MANIKAVVFDAFGTLVKINAQRTKPYAQLMKMLADLGRPPGIHDIQNIMTQPLGIIGAANFFSMNTWADDISRGEVLDKLAAIELDLHKELMGIELFPESVDVLLTLKDLGIKIGICSNLAQPYAVPVKALMPFELDSYTWSFEAGFLKPERQIYQQVCDSLQLPAKEILFVGDTVDADVTGPCKFGMRSIQIKHGDNGNDLYHVIELARKHLKWKETTTLE